MFYLSLDFSRLNDFWIIFCCFFSILGLWTFTRSLSDSLSRCLLMIIPSNCNDITRCRLPDRCSNNMCRCWWINNNWWLLNLSGSCLLFFLTSRLSCIRLFWHTSTNFFLVLNILFIFCFLCVFCLFPFHLLELLILIHFRTSYNLFNLSFIIYDQWTQCLQIN